MGIVGYRACIHFHINRVQTLMSQILNSTVARQRSVAMRDVNHLASVVTVLRNFLTRFAQITDRAAPVEIVLLLHLHLLIITTVRLTHTPRTLSNYLELLPLVHAGT